MSKFNFEAAEAEASKLPDRPAPSLAAIVMGQSGAGKSYLAGTMPGKTLFLYTQGEEHGRDSARLAASSRPGCTVIPLAIDVVDGKVVGHDTAYKRLLSILSDGEGMKEAGFTTVAIDGLTEMEFLVRNTSQWSLHCLTKKTNEHDKWKEGDASLLMIRPIMDALRALQRDYGLNYYVTCIAVVSALADDGEIRGGQPKLIGFELAAQLIPQFPDQMILGIMSNSAGEKSPRLQFEAKLTKSVKNDKTGEVKKFIGFTPRLRGVPANFLPSSMPADLGLVMQQKETDWSAEEAE